MYIYKFEETTDLSQVTVVCQWLAAGQWFSPGTLVSSTNKTDRHDITESGIKHHNPKPVKVWFKFFFFFFRHLSMYRSMQSYRHAFINMNFYMNKFGVTTWFYEMSYSGLVWWLQSCCQSINFKDDLLFQTLHRCRHKNCRQITSRLRRRETHDTTMYILYVFFVVLLSQACHHSIPVIYSFQLRVAIETKMWSNTKLNT